LAFRQSINRFAAGWQDVFRMNPGEFCLPGTPRFIRRTTSFRIFFWRRPVVHASGFVLS